MEQITMYKAQNGKLFTSEKECIDYENSVNPTFEKSKMFSDYGSILTEYSFPSPSYIYIHPSEFNVMKYFLETHNRKIDRVSDYNLYYLHCMTYYPIEKRIYEYEEHLKKFTKQKEEFEKLFKNILTKC